MTEEILLAKTYEMVKEIRERGALFELKWIISESLKEFLSTKTLWGIEVSFSKLVETDCIVLSAKEYADYAMEWEKMYMKENNL